jgi:hypothetical protein
MLPPGYFKAGTPVKNPDWHGPYYGWDLGWRPPEFIANGYLKPGVTLIASYFVANMLGKDE